MITELHLEPYDYVELQNGDLACVMWSFPEQCSAAGYVFYAAALASAAAPRTTFGDRTYWKLYPGKDRTLLDAHAQTYGQETAFRDPVGGLMLRITKTTTARQFRTRECLCNLFDRDASIQEILDVLQLSPSTTGITGSTMLGRVAPPDLDIVIYDAVEGQRAATILREFIPRHPEVWLAGYWNRSHHYRRFRFGDRIVCPRFPLPRTMFGMLSNSQQVGLTGRLSGIVVSAEWGHCAPARYRIQTRDASPWFGRGDELTFYSSESAHILAFKENDPVVVDRARVWKSSKTVFLTAQMGDVDVLRPGC